MTHEEQVAALRGDYRSDSTAEAHGCYRRRRPVTPPVALVIDPRNVSRPVDWPRKWC